LGLLVFAPLVHAQDRRDVLVAAEPATDSDLGAGIPEFGALRNYVREIGLESSRPAERTINSPHPRFEHAEFAALREYASDIGIVAAPAAAQSEGGWVHPDVGVAVAAVPHAAIAGHPDLGAVPQIGSHHPDVEDEAAPAAAPSQSGWVHPDVGAPLAANPHAAIAGHPDLDRVPHISGHHPDIEDPDFIALRDYAREIAGGPPRLPDATYQVAKSDNAFDALREMLRKQTEPAPAPGAPPMSIQGGQCHHRRGGIPLSSMRIGSVRRPA
jgi:hypothetical protein